MGTENKNGQGLQERLKLCAHDQINEQYHQGEGEHHGLLHLLHILVPAAADYRVPFRKADCRELLLYVINRAAEVAPGYIGAQYHDAALLFAVDARGTDAFHHLRDFMQIMDRAER